MWYDIYITKSKEVGIVEEIDNELIEMANDNYELYELVRESLEDVKNNNVMTLEELKREVATWK